MKAKTRFFMDVLCMLSPASASSLAVVVERQFSWDFDMEAVDAGRGGNVDRQAILGEAQVGGDLRQLDLAQHFALRRDDADAARACRPEVSGGVNLQAVGNSRAHTALIGDEHMAVGDGAVFGDVPGLDVLLRPGVRDIENLAVG